MRTSWPRGPVLVFAAHPDDETIGCGGALIAHRRRGDAVRVVFVTDGAAGDPRRPRRPGALAALRRREARAAAKVLGVEELEFWDYPDGALAGARGLARRVAGVLGAYRPDVLYRPPADDAHPDHGALGRAVEAALRRERPRLLDCRYEVWPCAKPTAVLDISRDFLRKSKALKAYRSQRPYLDSVAMIRRLNASRGLLIGAPYAEGYRLRSLGRP